MLKTLQNAFKIKEVREKLLYTFFMLVVTRIGSQLPIPGVNTTFFQELFTRQSNDAFGFFNTITGGSFTNMSVFALSITPYITSSIIMQLLTIAIPKLEEMQQEGEDGRKKIAEYTRYLTVALALMQSVAMAIGFGGKGLLVEFTALNVIVAIVTMTAGSAMLMWIGERITENGVGNGISIVLLFNIISTMPSDMITLYERFLQGKIVAVAVVTAVIIVAVIVAAIFMLLYIWFRFKDIRFASSAVLALLHDVLVVFAFYGISRISVGNTFIACMLTIVGYSINATIVIFDRIRENTKGSRSNLEEIVNESITQTLTRSMYTSFTTFVMVAVLYIMGVSSIREFAAPLMVGVICGAYSSVCITGALWLVMKRYYKKPVAQAVAAKNTAAPAKQNNNSQDTKSGKKNSDQPKKKNRKRVAERLAAQEAAAKENASKDENKDA